MDLFCNRHLVKSVSNSDSPMQLHSNGGSMQVVQKATMTGYQHEVWFSKHALTNILALSNLIQQYQVTYNSTDRAFVVHRETHQKPNMLFRMHANGLHYFDPRDEAFTFVSPVPGTKGTNVAATNAKTTRTKPVHLARDSVQTDRSDQVTRQVELQGVDGDASPNIVDAEATDDSIEIDDDLDHSPNGETVHEAANQTEPTIEPAPLDEVATFDDLGEEMYNCLCHHCT